MSRKGRSRAAFALILTITFASSGCGQKGPLFLPGANGAASAAAGSASAAAR
jgi:predicted small lipoprotein YifL